MGAIYASAKFSIVAADADAVVGILGIPDISPARGSNQDCAPASGVGGVQRAIIGQNPSGACGSCSLGRKAEEVISPFPKNSTLDTTHNTHGYPNLESLQVMFWEYCPRDLTYPEDALPAISGLLSLFERVFPGGFLYGLPEICFDAALLWHPVNLTSTKPRKSFGEAKINAFGLISALPT
ncbi:hypothetical protein PspLS_09768 [Pyricularia sp. CBS 133598]|nr:hypothetical protein PspLS_09768 [Pyricularia sp. CBS 133598]